MANPNDLTKEEMEKQKDTKKEESPEERGKKAIEANKKFSTHDKSEDKKNEDEQKDAEQWRNEG